MPPMRPPSTTRLLTAALTLAPAAAHALTPDEEARVELVTYAALYGVGLGAWTSAELDLNLRPAAWLSAALAAGAIWGTWEAAEARGLDAGQTALVASAAGWSMLDVLVADLVFSKGEEAVWLGFAAGALGAGAAFYAAPRYDGGPGDMSLVNSGGIWTPVAGALTLLAFDADFDETTWVTTLLALNLAGLATGAALASRYDPSREQVLYLDLGLLTGGIGGGLLGLMGAVLTDSEAVGFLMAVGGMAAGAAVAVSAAGFDGGAPTASAARRAALIVPLWAGAW